MHAFSIQCTAPCSQFKSKLNTSRQNLNTSRPNLNTSRQNHNTSRPNLNTSRRNHNTSRPNSNAPGFTLRFVGAFISSNRMRRGLLFYSSAHSIPQIECAGVYSSIRRRIPFHNSTRSDLNSNAYAFQSSSHIHQYDANGPITSSHPYTLCSLRTWKIFPKFLANRVLHCPSWENRTDTSDQRIVSTDRSVDTALLRTTP